MRSALTANAGSRGKIHVRCRHGRRASWLSQRHSVAPLIWATSPCVTTACCRSRSDQRASGTPRCAGSSHARALTATTTLGGKAGRSPAPRQFLEARQPMPPETLSPLADDLARQIETCGDDVIGHALGGEQHQLRTDDVSIPVTYIAARVLRVPLALHGSARSDTGSPWA